MFLPKPSLSITAKESPALADTSGAGKSLPAVAPFQAVKDEEPLQSKFNSIQKKADNTTDIITPFKPVQKKENNTGLPDNLKGGVENLSGFSMDDVKVHYNSAQPAQLNALAYAQGTDIHIAPGQEKHLPHEAWHVAQQKQGRVKATTQMKAAVPVNDDPALEKEADVMGEKAFQMKQETNTQAALTNNNIPDSGDLPVQRFAVHVEARGAPHNINGGTSMTAIVGGESEWVYGSRPAARVPNLLTKVGHYIQGTQRYIAGHLLNDNMGGHGVNNNLTVLSSNGNKKHRGIEGKMKNLAQKADLINGGNHLLGNPNFDHGARYSVTVLAAAPGNPPYSAQEKKIPGGLSIDIKPIRFNKATNVESPWPEEVGGVNDLTNHIIANVPPYPAVPAKKKPTAQQLIVIDAIRNLGGKGASAKDIRKYIVANSNPNIQQASVNLSLKRGLKTKFFYNRSGLFKVIEKNV